MSYIGNQVTSVPHIIDAFGGDNTTTTFGPLTRAPAGTAAIAVFIDGVYKTPGTDYTLNGNLIVFSVAPGFGSNIIIHHLGNGTTTQVPSDGSVTGTKLAINSVRGNNIVAGTITGNLIGLGAVSGNQIGIGAVSGNQIGIGAISGNNIGTGAISGNNIVDNVIRGNNIVVGQITGNLIGAGAISSNHYAGGGVTSDVLSANLSLSTIRVAETVNVVTTAISGNYNIHIGNTTSYYFVSNTTGSVTFNLIANTGGNLNDLLRIGQTASVAIALKQGATRYRANVHIDGVNPLANVVWLGASQPAQQAAQGQSIDTYTFTVIKIGQTSGGSGGGLYTVFASNTTFASANGQGMGPGGVQ
jgi:hypothetical protein